MLRRVASLVLVPMVLATQWAGVGHCHEGGLPSGHDARPHLHLGALFGDPTGHHDHPGDCSDHDADAVDVPVLTVPPAPAGPGADDPPAAHPGLPADAFAPAPMSFAGGSVRPHPPPGPRCGSCPTYLRNLSLLL
ncbi:MAG: hypothetical protein C0501_11795 [Isosphaera sp.]|nr:hypothetical protein [Isosphaera sp.]